MIGPMTGGNPVVGAPTAPVRPVPTTHGGMGLMGAGPSPTGVSMDVYKSPAPPGVGGGSFTGAGQMPPMHPALMARMAMMGGYPGMGPQPGFYGAPPPTPGPHSLPPWAQSMQMAPQPGYGSPTPYGGLIGPNTGPATPYQPWSPPQKHGANAYGTPRGVKPTRKGPRPVKKIRRRPIKRPRKAKMPERPEEPGGPDGIREGSAWDDLLRGPGHVDR